MVLSTSTNGTSAMAALNSSGRWLSTAPISSPPALTAADDQLLGAGASFGDQVLGATDEIIERVLFVFLFTVAIPGSPSSPPPRT